MREKKDMREKRVYTKKERSVKKSIREKEKNFQHVMDVGAMFIDLWKKYEYVARQSL